VLGLIDLTFFQLCDSCLKANSFEDINFGAISLESDRYGITRNTFQANIPGYLVLLQKRKSVSDAEDGNKEAKKKHLKLAKEKEERDKSNYNDLGNMVKKLNQVNDWKVWFQVQENIYKGSRGVNASIQRIRSHHLQ